MFVDFQLWHVHIYSPLRAQRGPVPILACQIAINILTRQARHVLTTVREIRDIDLPYVAMHLCNITRNLVRSVPTPSKSRPLALYHLPSVHRRRLTSKPNPAVSHTCIDNLLLLIPGEVQKGTPDVDTVTPKDRPPEPVAITHETLLASRLVQVEKVKRYSIMSPGHGSI